MIHNPQKLIIASRESRLAMWQARNVQARLQALYPSCDVSILGMTTRGDQILDRALSQVGGKGLFVKELEIAMAEGRADLAVHSLKDVPMELPDGFELAAILEREDPRDAFISNQYTNLADLPAGAVVGTSSLRRQAFIKARFPHLVVKPLRGNLDTRLRKLDDGEYAAIVLAAAGLIRLGLIDRISAFLDTKDSLPAAGQGAMAIEISKSNEALRAWLSPLNHAPTADAVLVERAISREFGGSCQIPLAAFADHVDGRHRLRAMIATPDGTRMAFAECLSDEKLDTVAIKQVVDELKQNDAEKILASCHTP